MVIHPPVDVNRFHLQTTNDKLQTRHGFIITGRQTPYKRFDIAVQACTKLNLPLTVIGKGPDYEKLKKLAGPTVTFKGWIPDRELAGYLQSAEAYLFPALDDFGISAVEALAAGTPVIAYRAGGALDYVEDGKTGLFFDEQTVESLCEALQKFNPGAFDSKIIQESTQKFSPAVFYQKISDLIKF